MLDGHRFRGAKKEKELKKTFVCLANSRKMSGRCVAGKTIDDHLWIRPISSRSTEEIAEIEMRYQNGINPQLLDIIRLELLQHKPNRFQIENHLIDNRYYWEKTGEFSFTDLATICNPNTDIWPNLLSSYQGINDRVLPNSLPINSYSLLLLQLANSSIIVRTEGAEFNNPKRKVRFQFNIDDQSYLLPITDPEIERIYLGQPDNEYPINDIHYVTISLGQPHTDGFCYLFAAGIIR